MKRHLPKQGGPDEHECTLEQIHSLPGVSQINFRPGFSLFIQRMSLEHEFSLSVSRDSSSLHFGFLLQGCMRTTVNRRRRTLKSLDCLGGTAGLLYLPHTKTKACYLPRPVRGVALDVEPFVLKAMLKDEYRFMPSFLRQIISGASDRPVLQNLNLPPALAPVLAQMTIPLEDNSLSRIFLEGKSLELLGLLLESLKGGKGPSPNGQGLDKTEREKIYQARDLLFADLANPPGLMDLAVRVGLSHTRLNIGFKSIFGDTAFACLRKKRLQKARVLLGQGDFSIAQVALLSGFSDQSHLTRAFSAHFGLSPKKYIRSL